MNLVAQGPAMTAQDAQDLARLTAARAETVAHRAFRFAGVSKNAAISSWCEARQIDCAWMAEGCRFKDLKLLAMDMDSTLITIECIDELADLAGRKTEVAGITAQAMRGEIDYAESLRRRVALLKGLQASALDRVYRERLQLTAARSTWSQHAAKRGEAASRVRRFHFFHATAESRLEFDHTSVQFACHRENGSSRGASRAPWSTPAPRRRSFLSLMNELGATGSRPSPSATARTI